MSDILPFCGPNPSLSQVSLSISTIEPRGICGRRLVSKRFTSIMNRRYLFSNQCARMQVTVCSTTYVGLNQLICDKTVNPQKRRPKLSLQLRMSKVAKESRLIRKLCSCLVNPQVFRGGLLSCLGRVIDENTGTTGLNSIRKELESKDDSDRTLAVNRLALLMSRPILFKGKFG